MMYSDFKEQFEDFFPTIDFDFVEGMNQIGEYGVEKYGDDSFESQRKAGTLHRGMKRVESEEIGYHAWKHLFDASHGVVHDKFKTIEHQHYAAAFNAMMENIYWKNDEQRAISNSKTS